MDVRKFSYFIIFLGFAILLFGLANWNDARIQRNLVQQTYDEEIKNVETRFADWTQAQRDRYVEVGYAPLFEKTVEPLKHAKYTMMGGALVLFIGVALFAAARPKFSQKNNTLNVNASQ